MMMEPMDLDLDREFPFRTPRVESPLCRDPMGSDLSDMEVDPNSPAVERTKKGQSQSSPSLSPSLVSSFLDRISLSASARVSPVPPKAEVGSTPGSFSSSHHVTQETPGRGHNSWEPALTTVQGAVKFSKGMKPGYGIPDGETMFSHFPKIAPGIKGGRAQTGGGSAEVRQRAGKRPGEAAESETRLRRSTLGTEPKSVTDRRSPSPSGDKSPAEKSCFASCVRTVCSVIVVAVVALCAVAYFLAARERQCKLSWEFDERRLRVDLENYLFGQHIATSIVPEKLGEYFHKLRGEHSQGIRSMTTTESFSSSSPETVAMCKPLVLSFSGATGVGKNFVSRIISEFLSHAETHYIVIPLHFPHRFLEEDYGLQVKSWITQKSTSCAVNVFVLDEMDKAFPAVVKGISEAVSALTSPCGTGSPAVFLLLSNLHAVEIGRKFVSHVTMDHMPRESLAAADFQEILTAPNPEVAGVSNTAELSTERWIDFFVPFLPLEKRHVVQCVRRDLVSKRLSTEPRLVKSVLGELNFVRQGSLELSVTGCKRVADKVDYVTVDRGSS